MVNSRGGTFTPSPAQQTIVTGVSHSPHGSHTFSAGASPSTSSPTGINSATKVVVAQVYLLLSTIKEDKDRTKWEQQAEQLRKLINENGMEVFQKYFSRLVVGNAPQIYGLNRPSANPGNYQILVGEVRKISEDAAQAGKIAEAIDTANDDMFRDFNLSGFMEHFRLDALEKTILALAFKTVSKSDLKTKADAILSANYRQFLEILSLRIQAHENLPAPFLASILDRFIQEHPPNFDNNAKAELLAAISQRYGEHGATPPSEVVSALSLVHIFNSRYRLISLIHRIGPDFTVSEEECRGYLRNSTQGPLDEEQVAAALLYTTISRSRTYNSPIFFSSLRQELPSDFRWAQVIAEFDLPGIRVTTQQFLTLYNCFRPLAVNETLSIESLWGGRWRNAETQLSFLCAFGSLTPDQLDATTIPGLQVTFAPGDFVNADAEVQERAAYAAKHPLVSLAALQAMFQVALQDNPSSDTIESKRLFQQVVIPNLDTFLVSAAGVPTPWTELAHETVTDLFIRNINKEDEHHHFVLGALWAKDKMFVAQRLVDIHGKTPLQLPAILEQALEQNWLIDLCSSLLNGFGLDLASLAHSKGKLDLSKWADAHGNRPQDFAQALLTFLNIKAQHELEFQRHGQLHSVVLPVKTISALLDILEKQLPKAPSIQLILIQRSCITAYPRLINYGEGFDNIIDSNGINANGEIVNSLPAESNTQMEMHYKSMYSNELEVRLVVQKLKDYKHSMEPSDQDVFACMIHGLFDEYALYGTYPLDALAITAVLFGGIISHKLISDLSLEIGLGMILEAVRDHVQTDPMYKFGLQALMQLFSRLREWPGFCLQLLQVPQLQGTEAWRKAEEVAREHQEELTHNGQGQAHHQLMNGAGMANGTMSDLTLAEPSAPPFAALHVEPSVSSYSNSDTTTKTQEDIQFILNNVTTENLNSKFAELKDFVDDDNQGWFAGHLVEARAKMQPNYHELYMDLIKLFENKRMWNEVLRETYISAFRSLNAESTMQSANERTLLKNLGIWLGRLTLARDKPIKYNNIAFKKLLLEAYDTQRLLVVIPFVCRVLAQGKLSTVFKPPNPWVIDIVRLLIELYHHAELKLNQKFEIEVLCSDLELDIKVLEPSGELINRVPAVEEASEVMAPEVMDRFENLSLNGMGAVASGRFSPQEITSTIPDLGPLLQYPPSNDMVNQGRLQEIVRTAITRAVHEIISPVVERSVTIAAISTAQMIHKDFATEPDEERVRIASINMVKRTAGSLALVTSKEPLRASMTNYIRQMSQDLPQGLPEGTIIMCVNSNLDLACSQVEKKAEERAIPEIEEMIEHELEQRRQHRMMHPGEPYMDPGLNRWSWTIPAPYKLQPSINGLNPEQMSIYDEFGRQPRPVQGSLGGSTHVPSASDATRSMANEILGDPQYPSVPNLPTPAEAPAMPYQNQQTTYASTSSTMVNGRPADPRNLVTQVTKTLADLQRVASEAPENHYHELHAPHPVTDCLDTLYQMTIKGASSHEAYDLYIVDQICSTLFGGLDDELTVESLIQFLQNVCRIGGRIEHRVTMAITHQDSEKLLRLPLAPALVRAEMVDWQRIDSAAAKIMVARKEGSLEFFTSLLDAVLLNNQPVALFADFAKSLEVAWQWMDEDPSVEGGQQLRQKLTNSGRLSEHHDNMYMTRQAQMEYLFEEWVHLFHNPNASAKALPHFISQLYTKQVINNKDDLCTFLRTAIDSSVTIFEHQIQRDASLNDAYIATDALARLIVMLVRAQPREGEVKNDKAGFLQLITALIVLVLNHHHVMRGERFNQRVFFRLFSNILIEMSAPGDDLTLQERQSITLGFAKQLLDMRPSYFPGFLFSWLTLVAHRDFLPQLMTLPEQAGWEPLSNILEALLAFVSELLKPVQITPVAKDVYRGTVKLLVVLQHDFPDFISANHLKLASNIPVHCVQLHNLILNANPSKNPDPLQPGLKVDRIDEIRESPENLNDVETPLRQRDLLDILDQALQQGPSEAIVAHIAHAVQQKAPGQSGFANVPINADLKLMEALVVYIGTHAIARASQSGSPTFVPSSPDAELVSMLIHELHPEARYHLINSMVNQLRFPNTHTHYFSQALLEVFGSDLHDQEESEIRQQITRVLLERSIGQWPQPWGLLVTIHELVKNEKFMFFELPFIKAAPEVAERFAAMASRPL